MPNWAPGKPRSRVTRRPHFKDYVEQLVTDLSLAGEFGDDHALTGDRENPGAVIVMGHEKAMI